MSYYDEDFDFYDDYDFEDGGSKKKGKGKLIAIILAVVLALAAVVGVLAVVFKNKEEAQPSFIQEGLVMYDEPELRLGDPQGIRFKATVSPELKKEVESDENKCFGFVIAPLTYFVQVDVGNDFGGMDWLKTFEKEGMAVITVDECAVVTKSQADGTITEHLIQGSITSILYNNTNREFLSFAYVKTTDGDEVSYKYASYPEGLSYKTQARSLAYVATQALNDKAVNFTYYSEADVEIMKGFINNSVDLANGLTEATPDGSIYAVTLSETSKTLKAGETFTLKAEIAEKVKVPVWWTTDDATVATVNNGVVTATGIGSTTVTAYVAGEKYECVITVSHTSESETDTDTGTESDEEQEEVTS